MIYDLPGHLAEEWRAVAENDLYEVSNLGRIRSWTRPGSGARHAEPRLLSPTVYKNGYKSVHLRLPSGRRKLATVHRLVAAAFLGNQPEGKPLVLHNNGIRTDNRVENLRWGTVAENQRDMVHHGNSLSGAKSHFARLTVDVVRSIRQNESEPTSILAERYGVSRRTVDRIRQGATWRGVA